MDLKSSVRFSALLAFCMVTTGCIAPQPPVPTVWQKLGIPQAGARLRDGWVNRRGNFPGLEKKPPVLAIADPANLDPKKPEMIKAAAEIKQDQDLKKQKIKAIKFLAEVNCGCYNKDDKVEAAFLAALEDCDPDIRKAGVKGLDKTAGDCKCRNGCEVTCCTKKIKDKLLDLATGKDKAGCFKEPEEEIRKAAQALFCKCPAIIEEPIEPEELIAPKPVTEAEGGFREGDDPAASNDSISFRMTDFDQQNSNTNIFGISHSSRRTSNPDSSTSNSGITNPEQLVSTKAVEYRAALGELLVQLPEAYRLGPGWVMVVVDESNNHSLAKIVEVGGRRLLLTLEEPMSLNVSAGNNVRLGLVSKS
ncbi:MAG: hypothetical protein KDB03_11540 [Planctomycetales bacterium]|nr:hypothetical protein [Planctomycetales bacterium]